MAMGEILMISVNSFQISQLSVKLKKPHVVSDDSKSFLIDSFFFIVQKQGVISETCAHGVHMAHVGAHVSAIEIAQCIVLAPVMQTNLLQNYIK